MLSKQLENKFNEIILERINGNPDRLRHYVRNCSKKNLIKFLNHIDSNYSLLKSDLINSINYALDID